MGKRGPKSTPVAERFWSKVRKTDECWEWTGAKSSGGYGQIWSEGRLLYAHRVVWELVVGPIPPGLTIDHLCRYQACVRPDHLQLLTQAANASRGTLHRRKRIVCLHGHLLTPDTTYTTPQGHRKCRECRRVEQCARRARRRRLSS